MGAVGQVGDWDLAFHGSWAGLDRLVSFPSEMSLLLSV